MPDPITTEDLYGTSKDQTVRPTTPVESPKPVSTLPIEETPEIVPIVDTPKEVSPQSTPASAPASSVQVAQLQVSTPPNAPPAQSASPKKRSGFLRFIGIVIIFVVLFIAGVWLSSSIRQFLPPNLGGTVSTVAPTPRESPSSSESASQTQSNDPFASWKSYEVISGVTKSPLSGVSFKLPGTVSAPTCDGTNCASQGTFLPGETRFTVAARGEGQLLADYRGKSISDAAGTTFTTKDTTIAGHAATEFTGTFTGRTITGFSFTKMHGVMIAITNTTSIEINHFAPIGVISDFDTDDTLFNTILQTVTLPAVGAAMPLVSPTVGPTVAVSSGS